MQDRVISIIMGIYNCEDTLPAAIDSVLAQTYTNWKLIMCDDCSKDNTYSVAKQYADKYPDKILLIRNSKNSKLSFTLNHCLEYVEGEFVARMDADDYIAPDKFQKQVDYLDTHSDVHLVGTAMQVFNDKSGLGRIIRYKEQPDKFDLRKGPVFAHASILTYAKVYRDLGGYIVSRRTVRAQDYDLWFRFYAHGFSGANLQEALYFVREDENAFLRRKGSLYFWSIATRWIGFRMLHYPARYYVYILMPIAAFFRNEYRKMCARIRLKLKK